MIAILTKTILTAINNQKTPSTDYLYRKFKNLIMAIPDKSM